VPPYITYTEKSATIDIANYDVHTHSGIV